MIRYLNEEEKGKTRRMYEANFPEDTKAFVDYYYRLRIKENRILVMEADKSAETMTEETAQPVAKKARTAEMKLEVMIHLNPYRFQICGAPAQVNYLVAVATDPSVRRQGKMRSVMERALQDLERAGEPFAFLIPANPRVYESQGFVFVSGAEEAETETARPDEEMAELRAAEVHAKGRQEAEVRAEGLRAARARSEEFSLTEACSKDFQAMASFANQLQRQNYDIFPLRDSGYYERMQQELASQDGGFLLQRQQGKMTAIVSYGREADEKGTLHPQLQEVLAACDQEQLRAQLEAYFGERPFDQSMHYMVRILSLSRLVKLLRFRNPLTLKVRVTDEILCANNGSFAIQIGPGGGTLTPIEPEQTDGQMEIQELTRILFAQQRIFIREWV